MCIYIYAIYIIIYIYHKWWPSQPPLGGFNLGPHDLSNDFFMVIQQRSSSQAWDPIPRRDQPPRSNGWFHGPNYVEIPYKIPYSTMVLNHHKDHGF